nr:MAG TPA: hypothetical protein [Caudoviricetes sp.]
MADAILKSGGSGGVGSDEVTASKAQVLQGYSTVTSDSDDEIVEGTVKVIDTKENDYSRNTTTGYGIDSRRGKFWAILGHGNAYYMREDNNPHVDIDAAAFGDALPSDIVSTKTATSKNGVAMRGTLPYKGNGGKPNGVISTEMWYYGTEDAYVTRFDSGAYYNAGEWKPYVSVPVWMAKQATNYHPEKTLNDTVTCNERGQIKMVDTQAENYKANLSTNYGIDSWNAHTFWMDFPHGNAYYYRADGHPHCCIPAEALGTAQADSVLEWQTATSQHGVKFNGAIRRWVSNTGHVITAVNGEGFAWDDTLAGRGRGIVSKIPNGWYIQGAEYVFLSSPNLYPQNIRVGVNINGITGTMPDYSTGRTVFNGATFDGTLLSGVANKDFHIGRDYYPLKLDDGYGYTGIYGGGINLALSTSAPSIRGRQIGCVMSQSVNLAPFNRIAIYWKFNGTIKNRAYFDFKAFVALASSVQRGIFYSGSSPIDGFSMYRKEIFMTDQTQVSYIDVGDINEHAFLGFYASANVDNRDRDSLFGSLQITRIDFLN